MKQKTGKLPQAAIGEILHVVNNQLNAIMLYADGNEAIENQVIQIAKYLKTLEGREHFDSSTFEWTVKKAS